MTDKGADTAAGLGLLPDDRRLLGREPGEHGHRALPFFAAFFAGHNSPRQGAHPIRAGLVRGAGAERRRRGSTGQGPWSKGGQGESEVSPGLEVEGGHEGSPRRSRCRNSGRKSRRRSASGRVHGPKVLLRGMQRGAKLPPCQDERPSGSGGGGNTAAHLASGTRRPFSFGQRPRILMPPALRNCMIDSICLKYKTSAQIIRREGGEHIAPDLTHRTQTISPSPSSMAETHLSQKLSL